MTSAHRCEAVISEDGQLRLDHLPFRAGQTVEVIIHPIPNPHPTPGDQDDLRGSVVRFDRPTDPVADTDWECLR
jgi:hypothetical protein